MCKPSQYINNICMDCHPQTYDKTPAEFTGEYDAEANEYLYKCCKCGEKVWLDEQWIKNNAVEV